MATLQDFRAWWDRDLGRYAPWQSNVQVLGNVAVDGTSSLSIRVFTDKNRYSITVREPQMRTFHNCASPVTAQGPAVVEESPAGSLRMMDNGYLGCLATSRRWRAGEDHHRGSDLTDGPFTEATWHAIVADMLAYELVNIVKDVRHPNVPDAVPQPLNDGRGPYTEGLVPQDGNVTAASRIEADGSTNSLLR